ncbi:MAG: hypothetical protein OXI34_06370 [Chloroflexota bacterium]|nr:hypothetical protein [Chloroflexota bacterium]MDE2945730.1 hypothetical protein [Chloroflexota bacterium]
MVNDEPQKDTSQQGEFVESITLASLLENPDPDFNVVVEKRSRDVLGRIEQATEGNRPLPPKPQNKQA